jgi:hypothetical protein
VYIRIQYSLSTRHGVSIAGNARVGNPHILVLIVGGLGDCLNESRNANSTYCTLRGTSGFGITSKARECYTPRPSHP